MKPLAGYHRVMNRSGSCFHLRRSVVVGMGLFACIAVGTFTFAQESPVVTSPVDVSSTEVAPVARLEVIPVGNQSFDLLTGETVLEEGGTIRDQVTGLSLDATFIRYLEGAYIEATEVSAVREDGTFEAPFLRIELEALVGVADQGVRFLGPGLDVEAQRAEIHFGPEIARFDEATASTPEFTARVFLLSLVNGDAILMGPYEYLQGFATLRDPREEGLMQLQASTDEQGERQYSASTQVDEALLETFGTVW